jgi:hypothetical protein
MKEKESLTPALPQEKEEYWELSGGLGGLGVAAAWGWQGQKRHMDGQDGQDWGKRNLSTKGPQYGAMPPLFRG